MMITICSPFILGLDYRVLLQNPLVIVPRNGSSQEEFIQLDLGRIYVYTTPVPEQAASLLSVEVEDFNVRTMLPGLMAPIPLLKNTALLLRLMQSSDTSRSVDPTVRASFPSSFLHINLSISRTGSKRSAFLANERFSSSIGSRS